MEDLRLFEVSLPQDVDRSSVVVEELARKDEPLLLRRRVLRVLRREALLELRHSGASQLHPQREIDVVRRGGGANDEGDVVREGHVVRRGGDREGDIPREGARM